MTTEGDTAPRESVTFPTSVHVTAFPRGMGALASPSPRGRKEKGGRAVPGGGGRALWELLKMQRSFERTFRLWRRVHAGVYIRGIYPRRRTLCHRWPGFCRKHYPYGPVWGDHGGAARARGRLGAGVFSGDTSAFPHRPSGCEPPTDEKKE